MKENNKSDVRSYLKVVIICTLTISVIASTITAVAVQEKYNNLSQTYEEEKSEWEIKEGQYNYTFQQKDNLIQALQDKNKEQSKKIDKLNSQIKEKDKKIKELSTYNTTAKSTSSTSSKSSGSTLSGDTGFRSWMPYTALSRSSSQWNVVSQGSPNEYGILEIDGRAVVAVGFGWNLSLGDKATVYTTKGSYKIIVGDWKAKGDTDSSNKVTTSNGCVVEFIVDSSCLDSRIRSSGSVASISKYSGKVTDIVKD